jgi:hypothetical protein
MLNTFETILEGELVFESEKCGNGFIYVCRSISLSVIPKTPVDRPSRRSFKGSCVRMCVRMWGWTVRRLFGFENRDRIKFIVSLYVWWGVYACEIVFYWDMKGWQLGTLSSPIGITYPSALDRSVSVLIVQFCIRTKLPSPHRARVQGFRLANGGGKAYLLYICSLN